MWRLAPLLLAGCVSQTESRDHYRAGTLDGHDVYRVELPLVTQRITPSDEALRQRADRLCPEGWRLVGHGQGRLQRTQFTSGIGADHRRYDRTVTGRGITALIAC